MKITDKIVTSVTPPKQTNVLWHNPETGKLKIFGSKGWEGVGGNPGSNASGGYPVVTVQDDFNITVQPNTFYDIYNDESTNEVNINFAEDGYSARSYAKHIMFTFDGWDVDEMSEAAMLFCYAGGKVVPDISREGYTYRMDIKYFLPESGGTFTYIIPVYFSEMPETGKSVNAFAPLSEIDFGEDVFAPLANIQIVNEDNDYLVEVLGEGAEVPCFLTEVSNDNVNFQYKYSVWGMPAQGGMQYVYTNKPYISITSTDDVYVSDDVSLTSVGVEGITVKLNEENVVGSDTLKEFVFNVNSPANIIFNQHIKWHNDNMPDLTQEGTYTISVFNRVGCYTFVNK